MSEPKDKTIRVTVKRRDLATDEHSFTHHEVPPATDCTSQQRQLSALVGELHPDARFRSYENHAALFVGREAMFVAFYEDPKSIRAAAAKLDRERQSSLLDEAA